METRYSRIIDEAKDKNLIYWEDEEEEKLIDIIASCNKTKKVRNRGTETRKIKDLYAVKNQLERELPNKVFMQCMLHYEGVILSKKIRTYKKYQKDFLIYCKQCLERISWNDISIEFNKIFSKKEEKIIDDMFLSRMYATQVVQYQPKNTRVQGLQMIHKWTEEEKLALIGLRKEYGDDWNIIVDEFNQKFNVSLRKNQLISKYFYLSHFIKRKYNKWTEEEKQTLIELYAKHASKWKIITKELNKKFGRDLTTKQIINKWRHDNFMVYAKKLNKCLDYDDITLTKNDIDTLNKLIGTEEFKPNFNKNYCRE